MVGKTLDYEAKRIRDNNMMEKLQAEVEVYAELVEDRMLPIEVVIERLEKTIGELKNQLR
ncbi:MAG: hypothetical protein IJP29_01385 [Lachnospiraceae bacterium]|nr:hypothetical protein [Lachnospiraceae bacterium]